LTWLITGAGGMLGTDLCALLAAEREPAVALRRRDLDLRDRSAVAAALRRHRPEVVVNCAAWTAVDAAEADQQAALAINGTAVAHLAQECAAGGHRLIHVSTDYVFSGAGTVPYPEDAPTGPVSAYGRSKLAGEQVIRDTGRGIILRTAWLYGANGPSFVRTIVRLAAQRDTVAVVDDQRGQPTWTADLAERIVAVGRSAAPDGIYHATNTGQTTWYGLAREIFTLLGTDPARVHPTTTDKFPRPAPRPSYSVLGQDAWAAAGLAPMRDWRSALTDAWPHLPIPTWSTPEAP
jgi:dTDP-4-dehydrorhamnose reductase